jgi:hypothetical protein
MANGACRLRRGVQVPCHRLGAAVALDHRVHRWDAARVAQGGEDAAMLALDVHEQLTEVARVRRPLLPLQPFDRLREQGLAAAEVGPYSLHLLPSSVAQGTHGWGIKLGHRV